MKAGAWFANTIEQILLLCIMKSGTMSFLSVLGVRFGDEDVSA